MRPSTRVMGHLPRRQETKPLTWITQRVTDPMGEWYKCDSGAGFPNRASGFSNGFSNGFEAQGAERLKKGKMHHFGAKFRILLYGYTVVLKK